MKVLSISCLLIASAFGVVSIFLQFDRSAFAFQVRDSNADEAAFDLKRLEVLKEVFQNLKPQPGQSALLLALDTDQSDDAESYTQYYDDFKKQAVKKPTNKTILFVRNGEKVSIGAELDYVASPQIKGWRYLGQARYFEGKPRDKNEHLDRLEKEGDFKNFGFDYSRIWVTDDRRKIPALKKALIKKTKAGIDTEYRKLPRDEREYHRNISDYEKIGWVSSGYYIADGYWSLIHGGAAWFEANERSSLANITNGRISGKLSDWYAKKDIISRYAKDFDLTRRNGPDSKYNDMEGIWQRWKESLSENHPDRMPTFTIERHEGRTNLIGRVLVDGNTHRSFLLAVDFGSAPRKLAKYDNPDIDFKKLEELYPELMDVFISPNQNTAFLLTKTEVVAVDVSSGSQLYRDLHGLSFNKVIMVEWAVGEYVRRWQKALGGP